MLDNSLVGNTTGVNTPKKIIEAINTPRILDSGNRTEFATGAVRDMRAGKGRMDLMPLGVVEEILDNDMIITNIRCFMEDGTTTYLRHALSVFAGKAYDDCLPTMFLEVGKHFEEGAKKYGENNWQKGIEPKYYIDSAIRHYLKWLRGDKDEPHDRAFVWNIMCCIWEVDWHEKKEEDKKEPEIVERVKDALNDFGDKVMDELNRTCLNCKHSISNTGMFNQICIGCRYCCNWEPKEED